MGAWKSPIHRFGGNYKWTLRNLTLAWCDASRRDALQHLRNHLSLEHELSLLRSCSWTQGTPLRYVAWRRLIRCGVWRVERWHDQDVKTDNRTMKNQVKKRMLFGQLEKKRKMFAPPSSPPPDWIIESGDQQCCGGDRHDDRGPTQQQQQQRGPRRRRRRRRQPRRQSLGIQVISHVERLQYSSKNKI